MRSVRYSSSSRVRCGCFCFVCAEVIERRRKNGNYIALATRIIIDTEEAHSREKINKPAVSRSEDFVNCARVFVIAVISSRLPIIDCTTAVVAAAAAAICCRRC